MAHQDSVMVFSRTGPTTGDCQCPCGRQFSVDSIDELNLVYDKGIQMLRAVCPRCARLEPYYEYSDGIQLKPIGPGGGRLKDLLQ